MREKIRKIIPHTIVNYGKHLPEAVLANLKYGFPGRKIKVIGVTGTDGKTTTVNMIYQILKDAGKSISMISTINAVIAGKPYDTGFHVTSPDPYDIQNFLSQAYKSGDEYMVLEVTSHALEQFRVWGVQFEVGVITNVTHEHLDYHGTFENYLNAKAKLIENVKYAILNQDDPSFKRLKLKSHGKVISFGLSKSANINDVNFPFKLKIPGDYNISNALAATAVAQVLGIDEKIIKKSLENFNTLSGRMEEIKNNFGIKIIVDFAHTPNALEQALKTLKPQTSGKLIAIFGCAAERDIKKRPLMGKISAKISDVTILTDEDPRYENSMKIINDIAQGCYLEKVVDGKTLFKEPDREKAIKLAISLARSGDTISIFGKGHEKSINYRGKESPWSDQKVILKVLNHGK